MLSLGYHQPEVVLKKAILIALISSTHAMSIAQYRGGSNDVWAGATAINQNPLHNIYNGGNNDGIAATIVLNQNTLPAIYSGGINDGMAVTITSNQNNLPGIYGGGLNDGFSIDAISGQNSLPPIYAGGVNDGFTASLIAAQNALTNVYRGGVNDGYAVAFTTGNALPIRLTEFKAQWQQNNAYLWWKVDMEENNDRFEVERSIDGNSFVKAGTVQSAGNTNSPRRYDFTDHAVSTIQGNILYYRLKQVDKDGHSTYSAIVILKRDQPEFTITLYPNPTTGRFTLQLNGAGNFNQLQYQVYDLKGQLLLNKPIIAGNTMISLDKFPSGTYLVAVMKENRIIHQLKIMLLK
jgi:hypothetical protein